MSITWNTGLAAERARAKNKSEPPANKKLIKKLHKKWCRANGYKPQASSSKHNEELEGLQRYVKNTKKPI